MNQLLVFQSDFGLVDGAVAAMIGVANEIDSTLKTENLTHDITPYNVWEASYRLYQTCKYWPAETVFVSVVDPGVGSARKSVVARLSTGQYVVTPDNGTLTHLNKYIGIDEVREIDETVHRREDSINSHTFHGRDVYAYTGAKLASGMITFEEVGKAFNLSQIIELKIGTVEKTENSIKGSIDILDVRFGSLWTNIPSDDFLEFGFLHGERIEVKIMNGSTVVYHNRIIFGKSFGDVYVGEQTIYVNSLLRMAVAINQGNFAKAYSIGTGIHWTIQFIKVS